MPAPTWLKGLQEKWNVGSVWQVIVILIVFACTGFTVLFIKQPILFFLSGQEQAGWKSNVLYYLLILPIYNVLLLAYGFLFGQFKFFWAFEKRFFRRIFSIFRHHKK